MQRELYCSHYNGDGTGDGTKSRTSVLLFNFSLLEAFQFFKLHAVVQLFNIVVNVSVAT